MSYENQPLVTAVIPVYNHEKYVVESIRSIISQSYQNIELIVINDGSKDNSHEMVLSVAEECKQRFVRFEYMNRENIGLSATLNQALAIANGEYFSALASDDIALPDKFSLLVEALETRDDSYAAAFGNASFIDDSGQQIALSSDGQISCEEAATTCSNYLDFRTNKGEVLDYRSDAFGSFPTLLEHNYLPAMSSMVRTELIREVGAWTDENVSEDWELWRKLAKQYKFSYVDKSLAMYRWHSSNSLKTITGSLRYWSFLLLKGEKRYCKGAGLVPNWRKAYLSLLLPALLDNTIPLGKKMSMLNIVELFPFFPSLAHRALGKAMRVMRNRT